MDIDVAEPAYSELPVHERPGPEPIVHAGSYSTKSHLFDQLDLHHPDYLHQLL